MCFTISSFYGGLIKSINQSINQHPVACARYELRNPKSHLPTIKHKYAENSIRYCLIRQLNSEVTWASTVEIKNMVFTTPYPRFKTSIKNKIIDSYKEHCVKRTEDSFDCTIGSDFSKY